jgi:hypothetical protein
VTYSQAVPGLDRLQYGLGVRVRVSFSMWNVEANFEFSCNAYALFSALLKPKLVALGKLNAGFFYGTVLRKLVPSYTHKRDTCFFEYCIAIKTVDRLLKGLH